MPKLARLNASQKDEVTKAYTCIWFNIIHGPPGTGKSKCLTVLLEAMAREGKRVLICAESNKPVDNLLAKFAKTDLFESMKNAWTIIRLGDKLNVDKDWKKLLLRHKLEFAISQQNKPKKTSKAAKRGKNDDRYHDNRDNGNARDKTVTLRELGDITGLGRGHLKEKILNKAQFVFSTQCSIFERDTLEAFTKLQFDYAIIDEASQSFSEDRKSVV